MASTSWREVSNHTIWKSDIETTTALAKTHGGLKPYDMESDIETTTALAKTHGGLKPYDMESDNRNDHPIGRIVFVVLVSLVP